METEGKPREKELEQPPGSTGSKRTVTREDGTHARCSRAVVHPKNLTQFGDCWRGPRLFSNIADEAEYEPA